MYTFLLLNLDRCARPSAGTASSRMQASRVRTGRLHQTSNHPQLSGTDIVLLLSTLESLLGGGVGAWRRVWGCGSGRISHWAGQAPSRHCLKRLRYSVLYTLVAASHIRANQALSQWVRKILHYYDNKSDAWTQYMIAAIIPYGERRREDVTCLGQNAALLNPSPH